MLSADAECRTAIPSSDVEDAPLIWNRRQIAEVYAKSFLLFDIISVIPVSWVLGNHVEDGKWSNAARYASFRGGRPAQKCP